jgi:Zn-dependent protease
MGSAFKIGRVAGIDLKIHWTFFLLLAFFAFAGYQRSGSLANALVTALVIVALFVCVVLHEYGHSLVAQRLGIEIQDITILPIGGVARLKSLARLVQESGLRALPVVKAGNSWWACSPSRMSARLACSGSRQGGNG